MGNLIFDITYQDNLELSISPSELLERHFWGIPTCNNRGESIPSSVIKQKILKAQKDIENKLLLKLFPQIIKESASFYRTEYRDRGFVKASHNILKPLSLEGYYNHQKQLTFPKEWLSTRVESSSFGATDDVGSKTMYVIPSGGSASMTSGGVQFNGFFPFMSLGSSSYIPNYWRLTYFTGFTRIPVDIMSAIEKWAAIQLFHQLGDSFLGVGISSQSISLDGLSQSISSVRNAESSIYKARITQYTNELVGDLKDLETKYKGVFFDVF